MPANCCRCPTAHCIKFLIITNSDSYALANRTILFIHPPLSVVIRLQPKGGLPACVRFDQKCGTKKPDLLSQIRILVVEVTGFEPATFWSRTKRATKLRYTSKNGANEGTRTLDLRFTKPLLYRLSYIGTSEKRSTRLSDR